MKKILLTQNQFTVVDNENYEWLSERKWYARKFKNRHYYASSYNGYNKKTKNINILNMHRYIMNAPPRQFVDHIDGNTLNNQRSNLRFVTPSQNIQNSNGKMNTSSKFKGVSFRANRNKWQAEITKNGKRYFLGNFKNEIEAALTYNNKAKELFVEYARLNEI